MRYIIGLSRTEAGEEKPYEGLYAINANLEWCLCGKQNIIRRHWFPLFDNSDIAEVFVRGLNKYFTRRFKNSQFKYRAYVLRLDVQKTPCKILTGGESIEDFDKASGLKIQYYRALWL